MLMEKLPMRANGYNATTIIMHWVTVVWVITMLVLGTVFHELSYTDATRYVLETAHILLGVVALVFLFVRVVRRLRNGFKNHPNHAWYEQLLSRAVQSCFMVLLVLVPITGLVMVLGNRYSFPGGLNLPSSDVLFEISYISSQAHDLLTKVLAATILLHILGAVKHAVFDRDGTLMGILKPVINGK